jgi:hypothetical protein
MEPTKLLPLHTGLTRNHLEEAVEPSMPIPLIPRLKTCCLLSLVTLHSLHSLAKLQVNPNDSSLQSLLTEFLVDVENLFCMLCPLGSIPDSNGTCHFCSAGTYSDVVAAEECSVCADGTYSESAGSSRCTNCPNGKTNVPSSSRGNASSCSWKDCGKKYTNSNYPDKTYFSVPAGTYAEAQQACQDMCGGSLVVPSDDSELTILGNNFGSNFWIGLIQIDTTNEPSGGWQWLNGSNISESSTIWGIGQPDNGAGGASENCAVYSGSGKISDANCASSAFGMCAVTSKSQLISFLFANQPLQMLILQLFIQTVELVPLEDI